jgi:hypothetical protein
MEQARCHHAWRLVSLSDHEMQPPDFSEGATNLVEWMIWHHLVKDISVSLLTELFFAINIIMHSLLVVKGLGYSMACPPCSTIPVSKM